MLNPTVGMNMRKTIVILGAGPAGLLLARLLAERGGDVDIHVYERAQALQQQTTEKSFSFAIFERGFQALAEVPGLEAEVRQRCVRIEQRSQNWLPEGSRLTPVANPFMLCERNDLIQSLVQSIEALDGRRVQLHFGQECTAVELREHRVQFSNSEGQQHSMDYGLLFGADGAGSILRRTLEAQHGYSCEDQPYSRVYRNFYLDAAGRKQLAVGPDELHAWLLPGGQMVGVVPQPDGTATCNLVFPMGGGDESSAASQWAQVEEVCPEVAAAVAEAEREAFLARPILQCRTIKMDCYHFENQACLLGDAAHAVPPSVGQGCNSSLEDAVIITRLLERFGADWDGALAAFSAERVPDMHALLTLSMYAMPLDPVQRREYDEAIRANEKEREGSPEIPRVNLLDHMANTTEAFSTTLEQRKEWIAMVKSSNNAFLAAKQDA
jgi:kynurenine 3-monooxygenase